MEEQLYPKHQPYYLPLFRADMATLISNRRSAVISLFVPLIVLSTWKGLIKHVGGPTVLATAIAIGLIAIGLMVIPLSVAKDRDKGIFQRLRVAPVPTWVIMTSRICVQLVVIVVLILVVFIVGYLYDGVSLAPLGYVITFSQPF